MHDDLITIEVKDEPDVIARVELVNDALFRVLRGVRLIEVLEADYREGWVRLIVEGRRSRPKIRGTVCVTYEPIGERGVVRWRHGPMTLC